jgi:hypothetical protein
MAYYVLYESVPDAKQGNRTGEPIKSHTILRRTHPAIWAARRPPPYDKHFFTRLLWWAEIPDEVLDDPAVQREYASGFQE